VFSCNLCVDQSALLISKSGILNFIVDAAFISVVASYILLFPCTVFILSIPAPDVFKGSLDISEVYRVAIIDLMRVTILGILAEIRILESVRVQEIYASGYRYDQYL
jgi:hypothetical protein